MHKRYRVRIAVYVVMILLMTAATASAQNVIVNPSFETGPTGGYPADWLAYGNAVVYRNSVPQYDAYDGSKSVGLFGNDSGPYNVSAIYQEFSSNPGDEWALYAQSRHWSGDPMIGNASTGNYMVQRIAFYDDTDALLDYAEAIILDGTSATDTWIDNEPISAIAPEGTVQVEALIMYFQADTDGGEGQVDYIEFIYVGVVSVDESSWGAIKSLYE
jgi:hypothetical protein